MDEIVNQRACNQVSRRCGEPYSDRRMTIDFLAPNAVTLAAQTAEVGSFLVSEVQSSKEPESSGSDPASCSSSPKVPVPQISPCAFPKMRIGGQDSYSALDTRMITGYGRSPISSSSTPDVSEGDPEYAMKAPRAPRPAYSEEQRFYIAFSRIVCDRSWPEIEDGFAHMFELRSAKRSKGGLTSVYYRIRKDWGLEDVLKTNPDTSLRDRCAVHQRASNFSEAFLATIGYLQ